MPFSSGSQPMKQRPERKYSLGARSITGACSGVSSQCSSRRSSQKGSQPPPASRNARRSWAGAASGSIIGSFATDLSRAGACRVYSARTSFSVRQSAIAKSRSRPAHSSPAPPGNITVWSIPSRSMSSSRDFGSVMPGRSRASSLAVPLVSLTPTPGRLANCFLMRSRRASQSGWKRAGMRSCQRGRSPPCPSASITWWPNLPIVRLLSGGAVEEEDAARQASLLEILERAGKLLERVVLRDELVDLEPPAEIEVGEQREVATRPRRAVAAAEDRLVLVERVDDELEARAELRDTDDGERTARPERVQGLLDDGEATDGLERVVGPAAGQVLDRGHRIVARGVHGVRRAEPARERELVGDDVDRDDLGRAREHAALHAAEPDAAEAEDAHRRPRLDLGPVHDRAHARHDAAANERRAVERHARVDRDGTLLPDDGPLGEGRGVGELVGGSPVHGERLRVLRVRRVATLGGAPGLAGRAAAAVRERREDDRVALLDGRDPGADGLDDARALVAEDDRRRVRDRAVDHAQVGVAEPGRLDRDADLAGAGVLDAHVLDRDRAPAPVIHGRAHHAGLPTGSTRPGRAPVSFPSSTIVSPLTTTPTTPSGRTCQRSSPPGMSRTSSFLPSASRAGSKRRTSAW